MLVGIVGLVLVLLVVCCSGCGWGISVCFLVVVSTDVSGLAVSGC